MWQFLCRAMRQKFLATVASAFLVAAFSGHAQSFSDNFTRSTNSTSVLPWQIQSGNWLITNGVFRGGPNSSDTYGVAYITNSFTNLTISAAFNAATNAFGYGLGARVNPATGARYAAWLYPEGSPFFTSQLRLLKFPNWGDLTYQTLSFTNIGTLGTNWHTVALVLNSNQINVYLDGALMISSTDNSSPYLSGGASLDMYTFGSSIYPLYVDNVSVAPINYPPISANDLFTLRGNVSQTIPAPGVLYNDSDIDSTNLTALLIAATTNGTLNLMSNGGFTYLRTNAAANYDFFKYEVTDGNSTSGVATVSLTLTKGGEFFSDSFARATNSASLLPWTNHSGNWVITNDVIVGGTNNLPSYATAHTGNDWTDYVVEGSFLFPSNAYGGGIAARVNTATGQRYAAWMYPELSDRGPNNIRIAKFLSWDTYGYNGFNAAAIAAIHIDAVVMTNTWHTLKLAVQTNLLSVYFDGQWLTNVGDFDIYTNAFPHGGISMDFFSFHQSYVVQADNISARPLVADDSYVTDEDTQLTISSGGVLTNDTAMTGDGLSAILAVGPAHGAVTLNTNGTFTYTPAENFVGIDSFVYEARDGTNRLGAAIVNITVESGNDSPQLPTQPDYLVVAGNTLMITNAATDSDGPASALSYVLVNAPNGAMITTNGVITWTPALAQAGTNIITTIVTDSGAPAMSDTNFITVIVTQPAGTYAVGMLFEDFDGVTAPNLPSGWITAQSAGQLVWSTETSQRDSLPNGAISPEPATSGVNELVTPAISLPSGQFQLHFRNRYDLESHPVTTGLAFDGGVLEIKIGAGAFTDILAAGGTFVNGGYTHSIASGFGNPLAGRQAWSGDSDGFITTIVALPTSVSGQTIQLRWRCGTDQATGGGGWAIDNVGITNLLCCNLFAPVLPAQSNRTINELVVLSVTNTATDGDLPADQLSYALTSFPAGASINTNGVITWMPTEAQGPMTGTFTTVATDKGGLKSTNSFQVTVNEVDVAPVFVSVPTNATINELTTLTVTNNATDSDLPANTLTYGLLNAPAHATINTNGVITFSPDEAQGPSTNLITTVVSDGTLSVTNQFVVTVNEVDVAPVFVGTPTNATINELTTLTVTNNATDSDLPTNTLTYSLLNAPGNATVSTNGVITWTPQENEGPGTNTITTVVSDGALSVTNQFVVTVNEVGVAPVFVSVPTNATINELTTLTLTNNATDSDLPANMLTYTLLNAPAHATISTNGVITFSPDEGQGPSTNLITTVVSDGALSVTNQFVVTVNEVDVAPVFVSVPTNATINELTTLTLTNNATDSDLPANTLTYSLLNAPVHATINTNGVITFSPDEAQGPSTNLITTVVNDGTLSVTNQFVVTVNEVDVAPVFVGTPTNRAISELTQLVVTNNATDSDLPANTLTYSLLNAPAHATINTNGVITFSPDEAQGPSTNLIMTVVSDGTLSVTNQFVVTVNEVDVAPVFVGTPTNRAISELTQLVVTNNATDSDLPANTLTYSLLNAPAHATINTNGVITFSPDEAQGPSTNLITTVVSDGALSVTNQFVVTVNEVDVAPVFVSVPTNRAISELTQLVVTNNATDSDLPANTLTYSLLNAPAHATINTNGVITFSPDEGQGPSTNLITTVVSDGTLSVTNSFVVTVSEVDVAPVFVSTPTNRSINELTTLTVTNNATDSDLPANTLTYSLLSAPGNATISTNGVITWTPAENEGPGTNTITTVVSDGTLSVTNSFVVTVNEADVAPVFVSTPTNRSINELTQLIVTNNATDSDLPANTLTYALLAAPGNATISNNGVITWTPSENEGPGTNTITTVVSDGTLSVTNSFVVTVSEVDVAPVFASTPTNRTINELTQLVVTNNATDSDLPANTLIYSLLGAPGNATISTNGVITWMPSENEGPGTNTITTVVSDGTLSVTNSFVVTVNEVDVAPVFVSTPTNRSINELTQLNVTNNATDSDLPANTLTYALLAAPGNATISTNGVITWTPQENEGPGTNTITTVVSDGTLSVTNSFVVTVNEVDVAPIAGNDSYTVADGFLTVAPSGVLANDSDADFPANTLTAILVSNPTNGVLSLSANGGFTYTPNTGFSGMDAFSYRANDGLLNSGVATVTFTVSSPIFNITSVTISNQVATVEWQSVPSRTYRLEYKTAVTDASWTPVVPDVVAVASTTSMTNFVGPATQRYYRVNRLP